MTRDINVFFKKNLKFKKNSKIKIKKNSKKFKKIQKNSKKRGADTWHLFNGVSSLLTEMT